MGDNLGANDANANGFAPTFVEKPRIIANPSGTLITMKCLCKAKPQPTVTWFRGQEEVAAKLNKITINNNLTENDIYELIMEIKVT